MSISITSDSKQQESKASGEKISMAELPHKCQKTCTKCFTLTKWPETWEMIEDDIIYCQKKSSGLH